MKTTEETNMDAANIFLAKAPIEITGFGNKRYLVLAATGGLENGRFNFLVMDSGVARGMSAYSWFSSNPNIDAFVKDAEEYFKPWRTEITLEDLKSLARDSRQQSLGVFHLMEWAKSRNLKIEGLTAAPPTGE